MKLIMQISQGPQHLKQGITDRSSEIWKLGESCRINCAAHRFALTPRGPDLYHKAVNFYFCPWFD